MSYDKISQDIVKLGRRFAYNNRAFKWAGGETSKYVVNQSLMSTQIWSQSWSQSRHFSPPAIQDLSPDEVIVRPYRPRDEEALYHICAETALMGRPQEMTAQARNLLVHAIIGYYPRYEPGSAFVAEVRGRTVGYIVGAMDTTRFNKYQKKYIIPGAARRFAMGGFSFLPKKNRRMIYALVRSALRKEFNMPNFTDEYPAHLHTNLLSGYRGWGLGRRMMESYLGLLRDHGVKGLHLGTTSYNKEALPFYERMGFEEIWSGPTTIFEGIIPEKVNMVTLAQKLEAMKL